ncbi:excalibur calcium-binding domain-containing protein [Bifidobacterium mongoliense]|uniref:excalibur calcium-binding domain-containing protein n=1 Tax=Bifidobacterium mongoliense TaxID=518643 RepID=UPI0034559646
MSDDDGSPRILLVHESAKDRAARDKLAEAKRGLTAKVHDVRALLSSSDGKVSDDNTRNTLHGDIDRVATLDSKSLPDYEDGVNALQRDMDAVRHSIDQKVADQKEAERKEAERKEAERNNAEHQHDGQTNSETPAPDQNPLQPPAQDQNVFYASCAAVRAAGKAPIRVGEPGYDHRLDRDGDGVGCE